MKRGEKTCYGSWQYHKQLHTPFLYDTHQMETLIVIIICIHAKMILRKRYSFILFDYRQT